MVLKGLSSGSMYWTINWLNVDGSRRSSSSFTSASHQVISKSIISLLIRRGVVRVMESIILERSVETSPIVGGQRDTLHQSVNQVRVADKVASIKKGIVFPRLDYAPGVLIIPAASREERGGAEDLPKFV